MRQTKPQSERDSSSGIAQAIAIYLARNYAEITEESKSRSPSLPGFKLRQITDWMAENFAREFNLDRLAATIHLVIRELLQNVTVKTEFRARPEVDT